MIIFFSEGRLGNQLFQYYFLDSLTQKNEFVLTFGFNELTDVFEVKSIFNIRKSSKIKNFIYYALVRKFIAFLARIRLISCYTPLYIKLNANVLDEALEYRFSKGLFSNIKFIHTLFAQTSKYVQLSANHLEIKSNFMEKAKQITDDCSQDYHKVFVHIRRGDYKEFFINEKSTLLPISYYHEQINFILQHIDNPYFIFLSDEPSFVEQYFSHIYNKIIIYDQPSGVDLSIMTLCNSAILSPSSFSWWGAYMIPKKFKILAPEYWLGFNSDIAFPHDIIDNFMIKRTVKKDEQCVEF